jgi:DNA-binding transcriptional regulator YiaG
MPLDARTFTALLNEARRLRRERRQRIAQLLGRNPLHAPAAAGQAIDVRAIRQATGLSQPQFAELLGIELATLRNWEQGRRAPTGPARALLRAIRNRPVAVIKALSE